MTKLTGLIALFISTMQAQVPERPKILGVAHIAIFAHDFEKSRSFYHDFFGFEEPYSLPDANGKSSMTFFKVNERQYIELFPEKEANSDRLNHMRKPCACISSRKA